MAFGGKPYSPELNAGLEEYLVNCEDEMIDNLFHGPEYFFEIKDLGLMMPGVTHVRVDQGFVPDIGYFVNSDYLLESQGRGESNMSLMGAEEGVYDPNKVLKDMNWSISGLNLWDTFK